MTTAFGTNHVSALGFHLSRLALPGVVNSPLRRLDLATNFLAHAAMYPLDTSHWCIRMYFVARDDAHQNWFGGLRLVFHEINHHQEDIRYRSIIYHGNDESSRIGVFSQTEALSRLNELETALLRAGQVPHQIVQKPLPHYSNHPAWGGM
jgi:hypothetical protein